MKFANTIFSLLSQKSLRPQLGQFAGSGVVDVQQSRAPHVTIPGIGILGSPLSPQQAAALVKEMQQAPFGQGLDTVVDTDVRCAWQLGADKVSLNPRWTCNVMPGVVNEACEQLGLDAEALGVQARLYKLICYEAGGHFKTHRDTEKEPGMFATLIVQLPSEHKGGDLVVQHRGETIRLDFSTDSGEATRYAAFYADCEHTLEPVTEGVRLVLAYNLVRTKADQGMYPQAGEQQAGRAKLTEALRAWNGGIRRTAEEGAKKTKKRKTPPTRGGASSESDPPPQKLVYLLEHKYSKTSLSFDGLKGADRTLVRALRNLRQPHSNDAAVVAVAGGSVRGSASKVTVVPGAERRYDEPLLDVYLCLIERHFHNPDTLSGSYPLEEEVSFPLWIGEKGTTLPFSQLNIDFDSEILGKRRPYGEERRKKGVEADEKGDDGTFYEEAAGVKKSLNEDDDEEEDDDNDDDDDEGEDEDGWEEDTPDKEEEVGYTGNDGYTADTWYYTAAIVFWPRSEAFRMVSEAGSFLRLAELAEDAVARGAPYADKYLSDVIDMLLKNSQKKDAPTSGEDMQAAVTIVFQIVPSVDLLVRAVHASVIREVDYDELLIADITKAILRLLAASTASSTVVGDGVEIAIGHLLSAGKTKCAVDLVLSIRAAAAATPMIGANDNVTVPLLSGLTDRLALVIAMHIATTKRISVETLSQLPHLATFDCCDSLLLEKINKNIRKKNVHTQLTFAQYAEVAESFLTAPPIPHDQGNKAVTTILSHCSTALTSEGSPDAEEVVAMFRTLLKLYKLPTRTATAASFDDDYRDVLESLADAVKAHPESEALLQQLLANTDVQEAIRRGDSFTRALVDCTRVQQLITTAAAQEGPHYEAAYVSELLDLLVDKNTPAVGSNAEKKAIFAKLFTSVTSTELLARAVQASIVRDALALFYDGQILNMLSEAIVSLLEASASDSDLSHLETAIGHLLSAGKTECAVNLVNRIRAEALVTSSDTAPGIAPLLLQLVDRLALFMAKHIEDQGINIFLVPSLTPNDAVLLPFLASFDCCIPFLERALAAYTDSKGDTQQQLTFSQLLAIGRAVSGAPAILPKSHKALAAILGHCSGALASGDWNDTGEVAELYWALLQLSQLPTTSTTSTIDYRSVLESLADAIKAHHQCEDLLVSLFRSHIMWDVIRHGDSISRSLCEYRIQHLASLPLRFPDAVFELSSEVQDFLHGPEKTLKVTKFSSRYSADAFAASCVRVDLNYNYRMMAVVEEVKGEEEDVKEEDKKFHVILTKIDFYGRKLSPDDKQLAELRRLLAQKR